jgi:predicted amidohydrolase
MLAAAGGRRGIAVLGGAIVARPRHRASVTTRPCSSTPSGSCARTYAKLHLPHEEGFWEKAHYVPGREPPQVTELDGFPLGIQICSDVNRPEGTHLLAAQGALAVLAPRATEPDSWEDWKLVLRANARTACCYVASVNRPAASGASPWGGPPSWPAPAAKSCWRTGETLSLARLERATVEAARARYPGYVAVRSEVYAAGWTALAEPLRVDER